MKQRVCIVQGPSMSSYNKDLLKSILGGEMRNAWQQETRQGQDIRPEDMKGMDRRPRSNLYRDNYDKIDWKAK